MASPTETQAPFSLRAGMHLMTALRLLDPGCEGLEAELERQVARAPGMFRDAPMVLDLQALGEDDALPDFARLMKAMRAEGIVPVGVRNAGAAQKIAAREAGWAILPDNRQADRPAVEPAPASAGAAEDAPEAPTEAVPEPVAPAAPERAGHASARVHDRPVRSGQQVYSTTDLVLLAPVSTGAEVLAEGCIHVYGPLRGRALAGIQGDENARIFCQALEAELVAVAGHYRVLEEIPTELRNTPVQVRLEKEQIIIEPLAPTTRVERK